MGALRFLPNYRTTSGKIQGTAKTSALCGSSDTVSALISMITPAAGDAADAADAAGSPDTGGQPSGPPTDDTPNASTHYLTNRTRTRSPPSRGRRVGRYICCRRGFRTRPRFSGM